MALIPAPLEDLSGCGFRSANPDWSEGSDVSESAAATARLGDTTATPIH